MNLVHLRAASLIGAMLSLTACTSVENSYVDLFTLENDLPPEARSLQSVSLGELLLLGPPGVREFEIGRRFEKGMGGLAQDLPCALAFYDLSGRTRTNLYELRTPGGMQHINYLGFSHARAAARRLRRDSALVSNDTARCLAGANS